jgi:regulator of nucleoside diphosphate kinase
MIVLNVCLVQQTGSRIMTTTLASFDLSPKIVLGVQEHRQLTSLALAGNSHSSDDADWLLHELERASVMPDQSVPADAVKMNSIVAFRTVGGDERSVQLVFPKDADISKGRISVLTPVGSALIGLRTGQSITWVTRDGRKQLLTVLAVRQPDDPDGGGSWPSAA